ncbi:MAG: class I SAM-dependent methyltransferase [Phycisphaerales bacterium]
MNDRFEPAPARVVPTRDGYNQWSAVYDSDGNPLVALEERVAPPLLGDVRDLSVADIGCGTGRHALRLAAEGAKVTALDFSSGMLAAARSKPGAEHVRWVEHDLSRPLPFEAGTFDRVVCALVFDHVENVGGLMGELGRIARPARDGGFVLVTVMHPAMMLRGVQARFIDPATGERVMPRSAPNSVSDYVRGALGAGLRIEHMSEHAVDEELLRIAPRAAKHGLGWPLLLVMRVSR